MSEFYGVWIIYQLSCWKKKRVVAERMEWNGKDEDVAISMGLWDRQEDTVIAMWQGIWMRKTFLWVTPSWAFRWLMVASWRGGWWVFFPPSRMGTRGSYHMPWAGWEWGLGHWITNLLSLFSPSNTQKILFSWKAVIVSFADLEMPAVLQRLEKEGQREEAELSCWVKEKGRKT